MVDYKKWDDMVKDLGDDDDELPRKQPTVTKLEAASRVTIDRTGATFTNLEQNTGSEISRYIGQKTSATVPTIPIKWTKNGGLVRESYYWSQTADEVTMRLILPNEINTAAKNIKVSYSNDYGSPRRLEVFVSSKPLLCDCLKHEIILEDSDVDDGLSWEIETLDSTRYISISFRKKTLPGTTVWWDRVFVNDPPIDLMQIEGRKSNIAETKGLWEEAHRMFREKISKQKSQRIEIESDDDV